MSVSAEDRFAPPVAHVADVAGPDTGEVLAGRGMRLLAVLIDGAIQATALKVLSLIPAIAAIQGNANDASFLAWTPGAMLLGLALFFAIQTWPLLGRGQTLGKMICRLRIVRSDGGKPDALRLLGLRYALGSLTAVNLGLAFLFGLVDSLLIFRDSRKCLHDTIADTKVIKL
ncbi:RDD family protein [Roseateles chitinivorans]|uniref:RDD family protein n=1 Tax=Roseateles chitinivorans TaxID=2917965 RepID=UPI003D670ABC